MIKKILVGISLFALLSTTVSASFITHFADLFADNLYATDAEFANFPTVPGGTPTDADDLVTKSYADAIASGIFYKLAVKYSSTEAGTLASDFENGDTFDGATLATGERILIKDQADATENGIYVVQASGAPTRATDLNQDAECLAGATTFTLLGSTNSTFQFAILADCTIGATAMDWTQVSKQTPYAAGDGLDLSSFTFSTDLKANDGLKIDTSELTIAYDDSSIGIVSNLLAVKALGITNAMLAGSIADSKLSTISTAGKVLGAAFDTLAGIPSGAGQIPVANLGTGTPTASTFLDGAGIWSALVWADVSKSGSVLDDIGDVNAPTPADEDCLTYDTGTSTWVNSADCGGGGGGTSDYIYEDITLHSHPASSFTYTNLPVALTAASSYLRTKVNLEGAAEFRIVVNQAVAGFAGSELRLRYSLNNSTFVDIDADNSGDLDVGTGTGVKAGTWTDVVAGAKQEVWLQLYGLGGDGIVDPQFRQISIQVKYNSSVVAGGDGGDIYVTQTLHSHTSSALAFTNLPAAVAELTSSRSRFRYDATNSTRYRVFVTQYVAGFAGSDLNLQYSANGGSTWFAADTASAGELDVGTGTGIKIGAWADLVAGAKGDYLWRLVGKGGDGIVDPSFYQLQVQFTQEAAGGGTPEGTDGEIQYNNGGAFGGAEGFTFDDGKGDVLLEGGMGIYDGMEVYATVNAYGMTSAPLVDGATNYDMDYNDGSPAGAYVLDDKDSVVISELFAEREPAYVQSADGTGNYGVVLMSFDMGGGIVYMTMYFKDGDFTDSADFDTWFEGITTLSITVAYYGESVWTNTGENNAYVFANPDGKVIVTGYTAVPTFALADVAAPVFAATENGGEPFLISTAKVLAQGGITIGPGGGWDLTDESGTAGQVLTSDGAGKAEWATPSGDSLWSLIGSDAVYSDGNAIADGFQGTEGLANFIIQPHDGTEANPSNANMIFRSGLYSGGGSHGYFGFEFGNGGNYWLKATSDGLVAINDHKGSGGFEVKGSSTDNLFYVDEGNENIGIGSNGSNDVALDIRLGNSLINMTSADQTGAMESGILMRYGSNNWYGGFFGMAAAATLWGNNGEIVMGARGFSTYGDPTDHFVAIMDSDLNFGIGTDNPSGKFQVGPYLSGISSGGAAQGFNEFTYNGLYTGTTVKNFRVQIDGLAPDTFEWSNDGGSTWEATGVTITGDYQTLEDGVNIKFYIDGAIFEAGNYWDFNGYPVLATVSGEDVSLNNGAFVTNLSGIDIATLVQGDLGATCTTGELRYDTGGSADELCYCQATNTWMCTTMTAGPAD